MKAKKSKTRPAPRPSPAKKPTSKAKPAKPSKPAPVSKGAAVRAPLNTARAATPKRDVTFAGRVQRVESGKGERAVVQAKNVSHDPFAVTLGELPELGALGDLPELGAVYDPIAEQASEVRVFGPELDDSPISEPDETLTHEDREAARLAELHGGFRSRMEAESKRRELATDTEYWFTVVFQDRAQKDQFLRALKLDHLGDKYIDGEQLADAMGVAVDKSEVVYNIGGADPKLAALVGIDEAYGSESRTDAKRKHKSR